MPVGLPCERPACLTCDAAAVVSMDAATPSDAAHGPSLDAASAGPVDAGNEGDVDAWVQGARDAGSEADTAVAPARDVFGVTALLPTAPGGLEWDSRYWEGHAHDVEAETPDFADPLGHANRRGSGMVRVNGDGTLRMSGSQPRPHGRGRRRNVGAGGGVVFIRNTGVIGQGALYKWLTVREVDPDAWCAERPSRNCRGVFMLLSWDGDSLLAPHLLGIGWKLLASAFACVRCPDD